MKTIDVFAKWLFESRFGKMKNTQHYKLVGSGAGVIVYQVLNATKIRLLLSVRSAVVGEGFGITGGGFVEAGQLLNTPLRTMVETASEAYREVDEENLNLPRSLRWRSFYTGLNQLRLCMCIPVMNRWCMPPTSRHCV